MFNEYTLVLWFSFIYSKKVCRKMNWSWWRIKNLRSKMIVVPFLLLFRCFTSLFKLKGDGSCVHYSLFFPLQSSLSKVWINLYLKVDLQQVVLRIRLIYGTLKLKLLPFLTNYSPYSILSSIIPSSSSSQQRRKRKKNKEVMHNKEKKEQSFFNNFFFDNFFLQVVTCDGLFQITYTDNKIMTRILL